MTILPKGTILNGPDGQGYEVVADIPLNGDPIMSSSVKGINGTPDPIPATVMPEWVILAIREAAHKIEAGE